MYSRNEQSIRMLDRRRGLIGIAGGKCREQARWRSPGQRQTWWLCLESLADKDRPGGYALSLWLAETDPVPVA